MFKNGLIGACLCLLLSGCSILVSSALDDKTDAGGGSSDMGPGTDMSTTDGGGDTDAMVVNCVGMDTGTNCSAPGTTGFICRNGLCQTSTCNDGYVDTANGEECEDGNEVWDDGCDPGACTFTCRENGQCDNSEACDGVESCGPDHICLSGTQLADNTLCTLEGGTEGQCNAGSCALATCGNGAPDDGEECDDGNDNDDDGCKRNCEYSCHFDGDCGGNACDGFSTCDTTASHKCVGGTPMVCDDRDDCTSDSCDPFKAECSFVLADVDMDGFPAVECSSRPFDCNDADASIHPGAPEGCDDVDNDCDPSTPSDSMMMVACYPDVDRDTYPDTSGSSIMACGCPENTHPARTDGLVDCFDSTRPGGANAHPLQPMYSPNSYCEFSICRTPSFDWNCDGTEERRDTILSSICVRGPTGCSGSGWVDIVPACGEEGMYRRCEGSPSGATCTASIETIKQVCR